jgi:hypothetical protein
MFNPNPAFLLVQKLKSAPKGIILGVKGEIEKLKNKLKKSICPKLLIKINAELYWPCIGAQGRKKRIPSNLGSQFATIGGQCFSIYFISNLGQIGNYFFLFQHGLLV